MRTGTVELRAGDVAAAQRDVQRLVDRHHGEVGEQKTTTDDDGESAYTRMVVRVPGDDFEALVQELSGVGTLVAADTSEEDVTTKVIDLETRIKVQRRSIARITLLFERAEKIRDVMAIEAELAGRQAGLDSLEQQAAYLARQTALSTVTVTIDRRHRPAPPAGDDRDGFVAGLGAGWDALAGFGTGLATVAGALLPWSVALALVGPPAVLAGRRLRRRISAGRSARTPSAA